MTTAKLYAILIFMAVYTLLCVGGTWIIKDKFDEAAKLAAVEEQVKTDNKRIAQLQDDAAAAQKRTDADKESNQQALDTLRKNNAKKHTTCTYSPDDLQLLKGYTSRKYPVPR